MSNDKVNNKKDISSNDTTSKTDKSNEDFVKSLNSELSSKNPIINTNKPKPKDDD